MERFPDGADKDGFFEKRAPEHFPDWVHLTDVETSDGAQEQVVVEDTRTLVFLADQACFTPHTWLSREAHLRQPDQMVFDLDPSTDDLAGVRNATRMVGDLLDDLGLTAFVKTSGGPGATTCWCRCGRTRTSTTYAVSPAPSPTPWPGQRPTA
jgi:bifunctional non-homologous end joining protein LigD